MTAVGIGCPDPPGPPRTQVQRGSPEEERVPVTLQFCLHGHQLRPSLVSRGSEEGTARGHQQRTGNAPQLWAPTSTPEGVRALCVPRPRLHQGCDCSLQFPAFITAHGPSLLPRERGWGGSGCVCHLCLSVPRDPTPSGSARCSCPRLVRPPGLLGSRTPWTTTNKSLARAPPGVLQFYSTPPEPCVPGIMTQAGVEAENAREDK